MSASLVGSEMCIRDSRGAAEVPPEGSRGRLRGLCGSRSGRRGARKGLYSCLLYTSDAADDM
eukprot:4487624-Alexandrium_andersonii.AAC.1